MTSDSEYTNTPEKPTENNPTLLIWNKTLALSQINNRTDRLAVLAEMFPLEAQKYLETMEQAISKGDNGQLQSNAHALKGVAAILAAERLQSSAGKLEIAAKQKNNSCYNDLYSDLKQHYREFIQNLNS